MEREQRPHTKDFYEVTDKSFEITELAQALLECERVHNAVKTHRAPGYLTPRELLKLHQQNKRKGVSLIIVNEYNSLTDVALRE